MSPRKRRTGHPRR